MTTGDGGSEPTMIDRAAATEAARAAIEGLPDPHGIEYVIREDMTQEHPFGWVFFHDSKRFVETGDARYRVAGNAPLIVDRRNGKTTFVATGRPLEAALQEYLADFNADRAGG